MTDFAASPSSAVNLRGRLLGLIVLWALIALVLAAPAKAVVTEVSGTTVGLQPRNGTTLGTPGSTPETFTNENGDAVLHGTNVRPIFWDPAGFGFHHEWLTKIDGFFQQLGEASGHLETIFANIAQYRDRSNQPAQDRITYMGSYSDTAPFPTGKCTDPNPLEVGAVTCLTDAQLREQLQAFVASHGLPKGMNTVYYLLTPPGVTVCADEAATSCSDYKLSKAEEEKEERKSASYKASFCSYHGVINPDNAPQGDGSTILYASIPWSVGDLGLAGYSTKFMYEQGFDCQDGGWSPVNSAGQAQETREKPKQMNKEEIKKFEEASEEEQLAILEAQRLEGPHQQEPNQEGLGELGDYSPGLADLTINQIAMEQANIVTDPLLDGWKDSQGNEATDECRDVFANTVGIEGGAIEGSVTADPYTKAGTLSNESIAAGRYYINNIFSLSEGGCAGGVGLDPRFTAPNPVNAGEIVGFDGMESTVSLIAGESFGPSGPPTTTYATFSWNFGDGTPEAKGFAPGAPLCEAPWLSPCAASVFHSYQYGGTYKVRLLVTDVAGYTSAVEHDVTVSGPPAPTTGQGSSVGSNGTVPPPLASAAIVSRSLKRALHKGLVVRYSVSEKVAGRLEVLLSKTLAKRLHIGGPTATNLPAGTPAQVVIAKAIVVTTKGGHSTIAIKFSKKTAARLAHLRSVSLMLRMVVRNAASTAPLTVVVLSKATLSH